MKKILLLLSLLSFKSFSQPILADSDYTPYSVNVYSASPIGLSPGNAGENQVWDFSGVTYNNSVSYSIQTVPSSSAPFISSFSAANFVQKVTYPNIADAYYVMSNVSSIGVETFATTSNSQILKDYTPDTQFIPLPRTFNQSYNDVFQSTTDSGPTTRVNLYDGYGTLITPFGTFSNVIRMKQTENGDVVYNWIATNPYRPLMFGQFIPDGSVTFSQITNLDANNFATNNKIVLYPNPTKSILNIELANSTIDRIEITDVQGKTILELDCQKLPKPNQLNIENLETGLYMVKAYSSNLTFQSKFIKE